MRVSKGFFAFSLLGSLAFQFQASEARSETFGVVFEKGKRSCYYLDQKGQHFGEATNDHYCRAKTKLRIPNNSTVARCAWHDSQGKFLQYSDSDSNCADLFRVDGVTRKCYYADSAGVIFGSAQSDWQCSDGILGIPFCEAYPGVDLCPAKHVAPTPPAAPVAVAPTPLAPPPLTDEEKRACGEEATMLAENYQIMSEDREKALHDPLKELREVLKQVPKLARKWLRVSRADLAIPALERFEEKTTAMKLKFVTLLPGKAVVSYTFSNETGEIALHGTREEDEQEILAKVVAPFPGGWMTYLKKNASRGCPIVPMPTQFERKTQKN
jgi:hypothetical protein